MDCDDWGVCRKSVPGCTIHGGGDGELDTHSAGSVPNLATHFGIISAWEAQFGSSFETAGTLRYNSRLARRGKVLEKIPLKLGGTLRITLLYIENLFDTFVLK